MQFSRPLLLTLSLIACAATALPAMARDSKLNLPIAAAMQGKDKAEATQGTVKFFFGDQPYPQVLEKMGSDASNRKTNAFGKSDATACNWVFLGALISLEKRAQQLGANAVINIVSNYENNVMSSPTDYECHAGAIMAGVALKGDFVKIADH
ncbi:MAG: excinuclease ATPase subunit [Herbaspirillum sp.]|nr:excinuclease ATPase subunit [Herbaspirillum sp.]